MAHQERGAAGQPGSSATDRQTVPGPVKRQLSPALSLFREAVLRDRSLQDQLRDADSCPAVAQIINAYMRSNFRIEVSQDLEKTPLRGLADQLFRNTMQVTVEDLEQHVLFQTNDSGEILLGESELAMVAGSTRLAGSNCYTCSCGQTCALAKSC